MARIQIGIMLWRDEEGRPIEPGIPIYRDYPNLPEETTLDDILSFDELERVLARKFNPCRKAFSSEKERKEDDIAVCWSY